MNEETVMMHELCLEMRYEDSNEVKNLLDDSSSYHAIVCDYHGNVI